MEDKVTSFLACQFRVQYGAGIELPRVDNSFTQLGAAGRMDIQENLEHWVQRGKVLVS